MAIFLRRLIPYQGYLFTDLHVLQSCHVCKFCLLRPDPGSCSRICSQNFLKKRRYSFKEYAFHLIPQHYCVGWLHKTSFVNPDPYLFVSDPDPGKKEKKAKLIKFYFFCFNCTENTVECSFKCDTSWLTLLFD